MRFMPCLALPFLFVAACSQPWNAEGFKDPSHGGIKRASFEMQCPESQLQIIDLDGGQGTVGVTGCGKKAVFKWVYGAGWVNNTGQDEAKR